MEVSTRNEVDHRATAQGGWRSPSLSPTRTDKSGGDTHTTPTLPLPRPVHHGTFCRLVLRHVGRVEVRRQLPLEYCVHGDG